MSHLPSHDHTVREKEGSQRRWAVENESAQFSSRERRRGIWVLRSLLRSMSAAACDYLTAWIACEFTHGAAVNIASIHYVEQTPNLCVMISQHSTERNHSFECYGARCLLCVSHPTCAHSPLHRHRMPHFYTCFRLYMYSLFLFWQTVSRDRMQFHVDTTHEERKRGECDIIVDKRACGIVDTKRILSYWVKERSVAFGGTAHTARRHHCAPATSLIFSLSRSLFSDFDIFSYIFCCTSGKKFSSSWSLVRAISAKLFFTFAYERV